MSCWLVCQVGDKLLKSSANLSFSFCKKCTHTARTVVRIIIRWLDYTAYLPNAGSYISFFCCDFFSSCVIKIKMWSSNPSQPDVYTEKITEKAGSELLVLNHCATNDKLPPASSTKQLPRVSSLRQIEGPHPEVSYGSQVLLSFTLPKPNPNLFMRAPETKVLNFQLIFHQNTTGIDKN